MQARSDNLDSESPRPGRRRRRAPIEFVTGGHWPYARLTLSAGDVKEDLYAAIYAQALAAALAEQIGQASQRAFADRIGIPARTLDYLLAGQTVPDMATLAQLEIALGSTLLPDDRLTLASDAHPRE